MLHVSKFTRVVAACMQGYTACTASSQLAWVGTLYVFIVRHCCIRSCLLLLLLLPPPTA